MLSKYKIYSTPIKGHGGKFSFISGLFLQNQRISYWIISFFREINTVWNGYKSLSVVFMSWKLKQYSDAKDKTNTPGKAAQRKTEKTMKSGQTFAETSTVGRSLEAKLSTYYRLWFILMQC